MVKINLKYSFPINVKVNIFFRSLVVVEYGAWQFVKLQLVLDSG
jgi:hypothetical protein